MISSSSSKGKGKGRDLSVNNNNNNPIAIELDIIQPKLIEDFSPQTPQDIIHPDPFDLVNFYNDNAQGSSSSHETTLSLTLDRNTAQQVLADALKMGDNRFSDLASLLLDDAPLFAKEQAEINRLFDKSQAILLPCKIHSAILVSMQYILQNILALMDSAPNGYNEDFYEQVVACCQETLTHDLRPEFHNHVGMYLHDDKARDNAYDQCLRALRPYLPKNTDSASQGYFAISDERPYSALREKIIQDIERIREARNNAHVKFEQLANECGSQELENKLNREKRNRRQWLVNEILQARNGEKEVGFPYKYKGKFTAEQLLALAGLVSYDAILDKETDSNVALLMLQYNNDVIYQTFFSGDQSAAANKKQANRLGLTAENYEQAYFWGNKGAREQATSLIKEKDAKGWVVRKLEKNLQQYLQSWYKKKHRLAESKANQDLVEKVAVLFIKAFNSDTIFDKRRDEAQAYLDLIHDAKQELPIDFYASLKELFNKGKDNRGRLRGSQLYKIIEECIVFLKANKNDFLILVKPNQELIAQIKELRKNQQIAAAIYKQDMKEQKEELGQKLREQQERATEREDILHQQLQAQQHHHDAQMQEQAKQFEQKIQVQSEEIKILKQQMQAQQQHYDSEMRQQKEEIKSALKQDFQQEMQAHQQQMQSIMALLGKMQLEKTKEEAPSLLSETQSEETSTRAQRHYSPGFY